MMRIFIFFANIKYILILNQTNTVSLGVVGVLLNLRSFLSLKTFCQSLDTGQEFRKGLKKLKKKYLDKLKLLNNCFRGKN